jgi:hypothetical protein
MRRLAPDHYKRRYAPEDLGFVVLICRQCAYMQLRAIGLVHDIPCSSFGCDNPYNLGKRLVAHISQHL